MDTKLETLAAENQRLRRQIAACREALEKTHDYFEQAASCYDSGHPRAAAHAASLCRGAMAEILDEGGSEEPSPAPQPDAQDEKLSPTPLEDCNWLCEGCGWTGVELTYVDVEDAHKRFHSKQGTRCKHGGLKLRITWPLSESSTPEPLTYLTVWMQCNNVMEKKDRELCRKLWAVMEKNQISLTAELAALRSKAEWVKCSERMPEPEVFVLTCRYNSHYVQKWIPSFKEWSRIEPTHWMPLPPPPSSESTS